MGAARSLRLARDLVAENPAVHALAVLACVGGFRGREDECRRAAEEALRLATARGLAVPLATATFESLSQDAGPSARVELRAAGETARRRDPSTYAQLTPQELQIARLVGEGSSNKEVAAQLFLSPRTVEYHLRKVFQKLAISSRAELIRHFTSAGEREELSAAVS